MRFMSCMMLLRGKTIGTRLYLKRVKQGYDDEELEAASAMMSPDQYAQEYECSWVANVPGCLWKRVTRAA